MSALLIWLSDWQQGVKNFARAENGKKKEDSTKEHTGKAWNWLNEKLFSQCLETSHMTHF